MINVNMLKLIAPALVMMLSGCGWVDSTGSQDTSSAATVDPSLLLLNSNDTFSINENTQNTIVFNGADNRISNWSWELLEGQANTDLCQGINGFDRSIASNSLSQSCADGNNCELSVEEVVLNEVTRFNVTTPHMRSPAALALRFTANTDNGVFVEQRQTLCAIPINNAPVPADDRVSVMRGTVLFVKGDDAQSLLANDTDDIDVRNRALSVDPTPIRAPNFAKRLELYADGGFLYEPLDNAPLSSNGSVSDSFTYAVSDGNETRSATVSIKISNFNTAPMMIDLIPDIAIDLADDDRDLDIAYLQSYFTDAENDALTFRVVDGSLPRSGNIYLANDGVLEGYATDEDSGLYFVTITVSDSLKSIDASFFLNIVRTDERNRAPSVTDISNKTVQNEFSYDVSVFFDDADDDHLYFTAINLPIGLTITPNGVIKGTSSSANRGTSVIRVTAFDGHGGAVDDGFRLRIR